MSYRYLAIHPTAEAFFPCKHPDWAVDVIQVKRVFSVPNSEVAHFFKWVSWAVCSL